MLDTLNGLDEGAWAGIAALVSVIVGGVFAALKGMKKDPPEVGLPLPPTDQMPYVLEEIRALIRKHEDGTVILDARLLELLKEMRATHQALDGRLDHLERLGNQVHLDTQVLRERPSR